MVLSGGRLREETPGKVMYLRIVMESLGRRAKTRLAALLAVALGAGAASGLVMIRMGVGDRMAAELRRHGANIVITPGEEPLREEDLATLRKKAFWREVIVGVAPEFRVEAGGFEIVGREPDPAWRIDGATGGLAGVSLRLAARRAGAGRRPQT